MLRVEKGPTSTRLTHSNRCSGSCMWGGMLIPIFMRRSPVQCMMKEGLSSRQGPPGKVWGHCPADAPRLLCFYQRCSENLSHLKAGTKTLSKDLFRPVLSKLEGSIFLVIAVVQGGSVMKTP